MTALKAGDLTFSSFGNAWLVTGEQNQYGVLPCRCLWGPSKGDISTYRPTAEVRVIAEGVTDPIDEAWLEALIALKGLAT